MSVVAEQTPAAPRTRGAVADRVGVVVSIHDTDRSRLERCLHSLRRSDPGVAIVVIDNSGRTDPVDAGEVAYETTENRGYGAAINRGAAHPDLAGREFVVALNDDIEVEPGWLSPLVGALDADATLGAVQPKLLLADTDSALVNSLGVELDECGAGTDVRYRTADDPGQVDVIPIDACTGGAVVFRRSCFDDLGGFDERYFLYYEDVDIALRGAERGWAYACVTESRVAHAKGATTDDMADDARRLQERNRLVVAARFLDRATVRRAIWLSVRRLRHRPRLAHAQALATGVGRMPRAVIERRWVRRRTGASDVHSVGAGR